MSLKQKIDQLAVRFAVEVFDAVRSCSLEDFGADTEPAPARKMYEAKARPRKRRSVDK